MERTATAIASMADEARAGVEAIAAVGTAGLRIALEHRGVRRAGAGALRRRDRGHLRRRGSAARVRRGHVRDSRSSAGSLVVFDTGGGSSQFTFGDGDRVDGAFQRQRRRRPLHGAVRPRRRRRRRRCWRRRWPRSPPTCRARGAARRTRSSVWAAPSPTSPPSSTGSPPTTRTSSRAPCSTATRSIARSSSTAAPGADDRRAIVGLQPTRAEVILAGACIVRTVLTLLGRDSLTVSDRGLRHGVLVERFADR